MANPKDDVQTARIPFIGNPTNRDTVTSKDQRFVNVYFEAIKKADGDKTFFLVKRPGLTLNTSPSSAATGRGVYSWKGDLYTVYGTKIYKNLVDLGVTLTTSTGICGFAETRPGSTVPTQYLAINDGAKLYCIAASTGVVTTVTSVPANTGHLLYFDTYMFLLSNNGDIWESDADDPTSWSIADAITPQMYNGTPVGLATQNNLIFSFSDKHMQGFFDQANISGSVLGNVEQVAQQIGAASGQSIVNDEMVMMWVTNSRNGGYSVVKLDGVSDIQTISTAGIERILRAEGSSITTANGNLIRIGGHKFYVLNLTSANRTFLYEVTDGTWLEWQVAGATTKFPIVSWTQHGNALIGQHETNGKTYTLSESTYQDDSVSFTVLGRFRRLDFDDNKRKFVQKIYLVGDIQSSTTNVSLQYSDDDYVTLSTARILDMSQPNAFTTGISNFRRRAWQISYTGANPLRLEALELKFRMGLE